MRKIIGVLLAVFFFLGSFQGVFAQAGAVVVTGLSTERYDYRAGQEIKGEIVLRSSKDIDLAGAEYYLSLEDRDAPRVWQDPSKGSYVAKVENTSVVRGSEPLTIPFSFMAPSSVPSMNLNLRVTVLWNGALVHYRTIPIEIRGAIVPRNTLSAHFKDTLGAVGFQSLPTVTEGSEITLTATQPVGMSDYLFNIVDENGQQRNEKGTVSFGKNDSAEITVISGLEAGSYSGYLVLLDGEGRETTNRAFLNFVVDGPQAKILDAGIFKDDQGLHSGVFSLVFSDTPLNLRMPNETRYIDSLAARIKITDAEGRTIDDLDVPVTIERTRISQNPMATSTDEERQAYAKEWLAARENVHIQEIPLDISKYSGIVSASVELYDRSSGVTYDVFEKQIQLAENESFLKTFIGAGIALILLIVLGLLWKMKRRYQPYVVGIILIFFATGIVHSQSGQPEKYSYNEWGIASGDHQTPYGDDPWEFYEDGQYHEGAGIGTPSSWGDEPNGGLSFFEPVSPHVGYYQPGQTISVVAMQDAESPGFDFPCNRAFYNNDVMLPYNQLRNWATYDTPREAYDGTKSLVSDFFSVADGPWSNYMLRADDICEKPGRNGDTSFDRRNVSAVAFSSYMTNYAGVISSSYPKFRTFVPYWFTPGDEFAGDNLKEYDGPYPRTYGNPDNDSKWFTEHELTLPEEPGYYYIPVVSHELDHTNAQWQRTGNSWNVSEMARLDYVKSKSYINVISVCVAGAGVCPFETENPDWCPNITDIQYEMPQGYKYDNGNCVLDESQICRIHVEYDSTTDMGRITATFANYATQTIALAPKYEIVFWPPDVRPGFPNGEGTNEQQISEGFYDQTKYACSGLLGSGIVGRGLCKNTSSSGWNVPAFDIASYYVPQDIRLQQVNKDGYDRIIFDNSQATLSGSSTVSYPVGYYHEQNNNYFWINDPAQVACIPYEDEQNVCAPAEDPPNLGQACGCASAGTIQCDGSCRDSGGTPVPAICPAVGVSCAASPAEVVPGPGASATFSANVTNAQGAVSYQWRATAGGSVLGTGSTLTQNYPTGTTLGSKQMIINVTTPTQAASSNCYVTVRTQPSSESPIVNRYRFDPRVVSSASGSCKLDLEVTNVQSCRLVKDAVTTAGPITAVSGKVMTAGTVNVPVGTHILECVDLDGDTGQYGTQQCISNPDLKEN